jgi:predicted component of type VI protein secretion system
MVQTPVRENAQTDLSSPASQRAFIRELLGELEREPDFRQRLAHVLADEMAGGKN